MASAFFTDLAQHAVKDLKATKIAFVNMDQPGDGYLDIGIKIRIPLEGFTAAEMPLEKVIGFLPSLIPGLQMPSPQP